LFLRVMKALSDPGRVKIIKLVGQGELCVCELTALLGLSQPTVSKHLRILDEAGLVTFRKDGAWTNYRLCRETDSDYAREMLTHLDHWLTTDSQIQELKDKLPSLDRCRYLPTNQHPTKTP
ncbi:MAG: metalloregulator ArsR/SmtB family transcription factor, partial [Desulfobulbaceae bacterium]|nr:metalloregulator ArsR/SmtB family transcription factor [Desulfobulbaceae bacterium]